MVALALGVNEQAGAQLHDVKVLLARVARSIHAALQLSLVNHLHITKFVMRVIGILIITLLCIDVSSLDHMQTISVLVWTLQLRNIYRNMHKQGMLSHTLTSNCLITS